MGTGKKEKSRKERQGKVTDGMSNVKTKGWALYITGADWCSDHHEQGELLPDR